MNALYQITCDCGDVDPDEAAIVAVDRDMEIMDYVVGNHDGHDVELGDPI